MSVADIKKELARLGSKEKAEQSARFFKTGKGEYGEGDIFLGVTVPEQRRIAKKYYKDVILSDLSKLLKSKIHEHRLTALEMLVFMFTKADTKAEQKKYVDFYLKHTRWVNNWDLVDGSYQILGGWLSDKKDRRILYKLARSTDLWENRIAIVSTWAFIRQGDLADTFKISKILLHHEHNLIHKAVGWMLREAGKQDVRKLEVFLKQHYKDMPRTMLRYAIEKFPEGKQKKYLTDKV